MARSTHRVAARRAGAAGANTPGAGISGPAPWAKSSARRFTAGGSCSRAVRKPEPRHLWFTGRDITEAGLTEREVGLDPDVRDVVGDRTGEFWLGDPLHRHDISRLGTQAVAAWRFNDQEFVCFRP